MPFENLPGIFGEKLDGNLSVVTTNNNPVVMVIGTAAQGDSETVYRVDKVSDAAKAFGKSGTLAQGLYETNNGGAVNIRLFRIGATAAKLVDIGSSPGLEVETIAKDDSAGTDYTVFFDASEKRLYVYRASDGTLVYDNNPADPSARVDLSEVSVSGTVSGSPTVDIGTSTVPVTLAAADTVGDGPAVFTAGTDGLALSRMETYEALYNAYQLLEAAEADVVVPMGVYLDDLNVMDMDGTTVSGLGLDTLSAYPTAGASDDALGKVYVEEVNGENHFWWWMPSSPNADVDATFTTDSGASIFPSVGSASATTKADGSALTGSDFHEVNFAYQLANFCYTQGRDNQEMTGVVGVLPPNSFGLKDVAQWVGELPTTSEDANGNVVIDSGSNGTGLLGNKFMAGRKGDALSTGTPGFTVNSIDGLFGGGFIATDSGWLDDAQVEDANDHLVDIGKYISVVAAHPVLSNPSSTTSYTATGAPTYGGFYSQLPAASAPTNKLLGNLRLPFRVSLAKLDQLAGLRYVMFQAKTRGIVVADAPTAARTDSDYQRLSTVRQVKASMDAVRAVSEPFLGEGMTGARLAALETAIDGGLKSLQKQGLIQRYEFVLTSTPQQRVLGQATVELKIVPAFELRQITVVVALAAV